MKSLTLPLLLSSLLLPVVLLGSETTIAPAELDQIVKAVASYESGTNMQPLRRVEELARQSASIPGLRFQLENALVKILAPNSTFEGKRFACQQLAVLGTEVSLPAIAEVLKEEQTVGIACLALSTHPAPSANTILEAALTAARGNACAQIANTLGDRRDTEAVTVLITILSERGPGVAEAAITALGKIATPEACAKLAELRKDKNFTLGLAPLLASLNAAGVLSTPVNGKAPSKASLKAAMEIYQELMAPSRNPIYVNRAAFAGLLRIDPAGSEKRILDLLHNDNPALKFYRANLTPTAIAGIRSLKSRSASAKFAAELPKLQPPEQVLLIEALASRDDSAARSALLSSLKAEDLAVRRAAITALGKLGDASIVPALTKGLSDASTPEERQLFQQTLIRMGGRKKIDQAIVAEFKKAPAEQKAELISILAQRGAPSAVPVLLKETANPALAKAAFTALGSVAGEADAPDLLGALVNLKVAEARAQAQEAAAQALSKMPAVRASGLVRKALVQSTDLNTRCCLVRLLSACPDEKALAELQTAAGSQEPVLRETAFQALEYWPDLAAWDSLAAVYAKPETESQRVRALRALVRLAGDANTHIDAKLLERYNQLLAGAKNDNDRKLILSALAGAAHSQALELTIPLLSNPGVRAEAELAVRKIAESIKAKNPQEAQKALDRLK